jgi:hypothetical protein
MYGDFQALAGASLATIPALSAGEDEEEATTDDELEDALSPIQAEGTSNDWIEDEEQEIDPKDIPF